MNRITDVSKIALGNAKTDVVSRLIVTTNAWAQSHSWAVVLREDYNLLCAFCHFSDLTSFISKQSYVLQKVLIHFFLSVELIWSREHRWLISCMCCGHKIHHWMSSKLMMMFSLVTDEELALGYGLDRGDHHKLYWEMEFKPVAEKLLERIQTHRSSVSAAIITAFWSVWGFFLWCSLYSYIFPIYVAFGKCVGQHRKFMFRKLVKYLYKGYYLLKGFVWNFWMCNYILEYIWVSQAPIQ